MLELNLINKFTRCDELLHKLPFLGNNIFCVMDEKKLLGIISRGDVLRFLEKSSNIDYKSINAYEVANKTFVKFRIDHMENDINTFLKSSYSINITHVPVVDNHDNLLTIISVNALDAGMSWRKSQKYELAWWTNRDGLKAEIEKLNRIFLSKEEHEIIWPSISRQANDAIIQNIHNKNVLEIGCGPRYGYLPYFWYAKERIAIEPLLDEYSGFWNDNKDISEIINKKYALGADVFIPELLQKIDGAVICKNSLDHTPNWPFVLSNISHYAAKDSYLYLWTDIQHAVKPNEGHYNINTNPNSLYRFIESIGFQIFEARTNAPLEQPNLFIELVAKKII